jgi:hypothetical protein
VGGVNDVLRYHDGDAAAAVRILLCRHLREQLALTQMGMSIGLSRGWKPSLDPDLIVMRHDRSIELAPSVKPQFDYETLSAPEWYVIVARCGACGHEDELDRRAIWRRFGKNVQLVTLPMRLRCRPLCGNRVGNRLFLRKLGR